MLAQIKSELFYQRSKLLISRGINNGDVKPFSEEIYSQMNDTYFGGIPISLLLKTCLATNVEGKCYDESLCMFFCFPNSVLVRGNLKSISYAYNGSDGGHGWIEMNDKVYDPTIGYEFPKELYYKIYGASSIKRYSKEDYVTESPENDKLYQRITTTAKEDINSSSIRQLELHLLVSSINSSLKTLTDDKLKEEWSNYLESIGYHPMDNPTTKILQLLHRK